MISPRECLMCTELLIVREGDRIIVEPKEKTLGDIPRLLHALDKYFTGGRPEFEEVKRITRPISRSMRRKD